MHDRDLLLARLTAERFPPVSTLLLEKHDPPQPHVTDGCAAGPSRYLMLIAAAAEAKAHDEAAA